MNSFANFNLDFKISEIYSDINNIIFKINGIFKRNCIFVVAALLSCLILKFSIKMFFVIVISSLKCCCHWEFFLPLRILLSLRSFTIDISPFIILPLKYFAIGIFHWNSFAIDILHWDNSHLNSWSWIFIRLSFQDISINEVGHDWGRALLWWSTRVRTSTVSKRIA